MLVLVVSAFPSLSFSLSLRDVYRTKVSGILFIEGQVWFVCKMLTVYNYVLA